MSATQSLPHVRKRRGQGASRRGEILAAATHIFLQEGVAHATMRRIAAAVGVSTTALYVYFSDKDAILQAIAEATFAELLHALEASQKGDGSDLDRFRTGLRAYIEFGLARPDAYRLTFLSSPVGRAGPRPCGPNSGRRPFLRHSSTRRRVVDGEGIISPGLAESPPPRRSGPVFMASPPSCSTRRSTSPPRHHT